jgi:hypothetical protein
VNGSSKPGLDRRRLVIGLAVVLVVLAYVVYCRGVDDGPRRAAACSLSSDSVARLTRSQFVAWARGLEYERQDTGRARAYGFDPSAGVRVEASREIGDSTRVNRTVLGDGCLIARVFSNRADTSIGLGVGWTFVWADSSSPYTASFVPEDGSPVVGQDMTVDPTAPLPADVASPKHICSECGRDWCVYPTDESRTTPVLFVPEP